MKSQITPSKHVSKEIQEILNNRVDACCAALSSADPHTGIHQARKELKKIRAMVRLVRGSIPEKNYNKANVYFRDVARILSEARDTAALLEVVMKLQQAVHQSNLQSQLNDVANHLMAKKAAVTRYQINGEDLLKETSKRLTNAEDYIELVRTNSEGFDAVASGLKLVYKRGKKMSKKVRKDNDPEAFHEWRKRVKYLRYHISTLSDIWPPMMDTWEDELHNLTDALGADHDLFVLHETILGSQIKEKNDFSDLFQFIASQRKSHQQNAYLLGKKLYYLKPEKFVGWLQNHWKASVKQPHLIKEDLVAV